MRHGVVLFASDRGITPAEAARAAEEVGFDTFYVPEHTHIPVRREAVHPGTGDATLPDDRYARTLDPWVSLATAAQVTSRIRLATAVALPVESDPITLAKTIATLDHLSSGRVTLGAGFGWNTDELSDHQVPAGQRRTALREYIEAMRALWTQNVASYEGEHVSFGPAWAYPKPIQDHVPVVIGAGGGPKTFDWIARTADGWMTTPAETDLDAKSALLKKVWLRAGRTGQPQIHVLATSKPTPELLAGWESAGVTDAIWGLPDKPATDVVHFLARQAERLGLHAAGHVAP
jgi:probable F420-dependent oxidoreductase